MVNVENSLLSRVRSKPWLQCFSTMGTQKNLNSTTKVHHSHVLLMPGWDGSIKTSHVVPSSPISIHTLQDGDVDDDHSTSHLQAIIRPRRFQLIARFMESPSVSHPSADSGAVGVIKRWLKQTVGVLMRHEAMKIQKQGLNPRYQLFLVSGIAHV